MTTYANVPAFFSAAHGARGDVSRESVLCHERDAAVAHAAKVRKVLGDERDTAVALAAKVREELCDERDAAVALAAKLREELCNERDAAVALTHSSLYRSQRDERDAVVARDYAAALMVMRREASATYQTPVSPSIRYTPGKAHEMFPRVVSRIQVQKFVRQLIVETRRQLNDERASLKSNRVVLPHVQRCSPETLFRTLQGLDTSNTVVLPHLERSSPEDMARRHITWVELVAFARMIATDTRRKFEEDDLK